MEKGGGLSIGLLTKPNSFLDSTVQSKRSRDLIDTINHRFFIDSASPMQDHRKRMDEMDFFSDKARTQDTDFKVPSLSNIKKEDSHDGGNRLDFNVNTGLGLLTMNMGSDESTVDNGISPNDNEKQGKNELEALQAEVNRMNEENEKLRGMLNQVSSNYSNLQIHFLSLMQRQNKKIEGNQEQNEASGEKMEAKKLDIVNGLSVVPRQFMDLGLPVNTGTDEPSQSSSEGRTRSGSPRNNAEVGSNELHSQSNIINNNKDIIPFDHEDVADGRGVDREESPDGWIPNKVPKLESSKSVEQSTEATMRKARVSVRARSEAPMISDGCQWRKYGQKMAKGNPCPRAYYRCTMAIGCPVRKQVQRCAEDRSILTTTYEGNHNHPLPPAAMAMASTTSAAVGMLLSGSMSSSDGLMNPNFLARTMLPCSSNMATISASAPFPTVTLDLTHTPSPLQFQRPPAASHFPVSLGNAPQGPPPAQSAPQIFGQTLYNQSKFSGLQVSQNIDVAQLLHQQQTLQQPSLADTVSAAITADPNLTAALVAAISSIIGGSHHSNNATTNNTSSNN